MELYEEFEKETGKKIYVDIFGIACVTTDYVEWLEEKVYQLRESLNRLENCNRKLSLLCPYYYTKFV